MTETLGPVGGDRSGSECDSGPDGNHPGGAGSSESGTVKEQLLWSLAEGLVDVDIERLLASHGGLGGTARWMIASLPAVFLDPPVGPCHTTARLATWQGVSRQAIVQGHRAGRLLGFKHYDGVIVFPDLQFGGTGRPLAAVRELLATATTPLKDAAAVAGWLRTPVDESGRTPLELLEASRMADAADRLRRPELYSPRVIDPRGLRGNVRTVPPEAPAHSTSRPE